MPEPTGNRWRDPDTGAIANPGNVQGDTYRGRDAVRRRLGPAVYENGPDAEPKVQEDPVARAQRVERQALARAGVGVPPATAPKVETADGLEEVRPQLGPAFARREPEDDPGRPELRSPAPLTPRPRPSTTAIDEEYEQALAQLQEHGPRARAGDAESTALLNELAEREYARDDGGRAPITKRLSAFGIKKPEAP